MILGLDFYNTIDRDQTSVRAFRHLAQATMTGTGEVFIITAVKAQNRSQVLKAIEASRVPYTEIEVVIFENIYEIPQLKVAVAKKLGVEMFVDDKYETVMAMRMAGIVGLLA